MRGACWVVCAVAALGFVAERARAQTDPPRELPPLAGDPFSDPFFAPPAADTKPGSLYDAATARGPTVTLVREGDPCACGPGFTTWLSAEWIIGRTRGTAVSPIVTTGPAGAGVLAGAVGQPATLPLFGGRRGLNDWRSGLRVEAGMWFDDDHRTGVSARLYSLFSDSERFSARPTGAAVVNVPHFVPVGGAAVQIPVFVGFPGLTTGSVQTGARTTFTGGDLNLRRLLDRGERYRVEVLAGYRQMYLGDELSASFTVVPVGVAALVLGRQSGADSVRSRNDFFGPQLGLVASTGWNRVSLEGHTALAMGVTASELTFVRTRTGGANPTAVATGLTALGVPLPLATTLAAGTNQFPLGGANTRSEVTYFGLVGEGGLRLNWRATDHLRLTAGYSVLYWNNVRRAQEAFASSPQLRSRAADFSTHLFSAGLDVRY